MWPMKFSARDPFLAALLTAGLSVGALTAAITWGWLGRDLGHGSDFCEALRADLINQPANTWSNLGFVLAGLAIGWRARGHHELMGSTVTLFACVVVLLGPASAAMHATGTQIGKHLDLTSMFLLASFTCAYALKRLLGLSEFKFVALFIAALIGSELIYLTVGEVPVLLHAGNAAFAVLLLVTLISEVAIWRRTKNLPAAKAGAAAVGALALAFAVWLLDQGIWCDPNSLLQAHAIWHLLCAASAFLLFDYYLAEESTQKSCGTNVCSSIGGRT